jgi:outer membrane protein OmpA-like peptidoglycan-associated protein
MESERRAELAANIPSSSIIATTDRINSVGYGFQQNIFVERSTTKEHTCHPNPNSETNSNI